MRVRFPPGLLIMPSTDIDGSVIVILSEAEAREVAELLSTTSGFRPLTETELRLANKIIRDLGSHCENRQSRNKPDPE